MSIPKISNIQMSKGVIVKMIRMNVIVCLLSYLLHHLIVVTLVGHHFSQISCIFLPVFISLFRVSFAPSPLNAFLSFCVSILCFLSYYGPNVSKPIFTAAVLSAQNILCHVVN